MQQREIYIGVNGSDSNTGLTETSPMKTVNAAIEKYRNNFNLRILLLPGEHNQLINIPPYITGIEIGKFGTGVASVKGIISDFCPLVMLSGITVNNSSGTYANSVDLNYARVLISYLDVTSGTASLQEKNGIKLTGCTAVIRDAYIRYSYNGIYLVDSFCSANNVTIYSQNRYGYRVESSTLHRSGGTNSATTATATANGGQIYT